jgi:hypothetical protein
MIRHLHAIRVDQSKRDHRRGELSSAAVSRLRKLLSPAAGERLVERSMASDRVLYTCAEFTENRAAMLAQYADDVRALGRFGAVRQKGALTSFHLPAETINHSVWRARYGKSERSDEHCRLQRLERIALTRHAEHAGCRLIINPFLSYNKFGEEARVVRLGCLRDFLRSMTDDQCQVAIQTQRRERMNNTYVGNWFGAESRTPIQGKGYYQTIFTRHGPSLKERIANFDSEFRELIAEAKTSPGESRRRAIEVLEGEIDRPAQSTPGATAKTTARAKTTVIARKHG